MFSHHLDIMDFQLQYTGTFLWNYLYEKAWYKYKLQSVKKHQLGANAIKK